MRSKIIIGYSNYRIYENGSIKKLSPMARRGGQFLKPTLCERGYFRVSLMRNNISNTFFVHRLVAKHFVKGKSITKKYVNHLDGNKTNNIYSNLEWCDMSRNLIHAYDFGLAKKSGKITLNEVEIIYRSKKSYRELSKKYGISTSAVMKIKKHKSYVRFTRYLK